jgi:catechol 2,3-dioxygenase-like lactoylglutathione lyase family enzyme
LINGIKKLAHVCLSTCQLETIVEFYTHTLGLRVIHEFLNPEGERYGVFLLVGDGSFLEFFNSNAVRVEKGVFRHLCFEVADIESLAEQLRQKEYIVEVRRGKTDGVLICWIDDPDGNRIEFQQYDELAVQFPYVSKDPSLPPQ